jgi:plastocyanin
MTVTRRRALEVGGAFLAAFTVNTRSLGAETLDIVMEGRPNGSHVWYSPVGVHVALGQMIRWINRDPGNSHTATAYHPALFDRPLRIPEGAEPWDSGYLLPEESFSVTLTVPGVYDYYCLPHEHAGMVGRIVVGDVAGGSGAEPYAADGGGLPEAALEAFPSVEEIVAAGVVEHQP